MMGLERETEGSRKTIKNLTPRKILVGLEADKKKCWRRYGWVLITRFFKEAKITRDSTPFIDPWEHDDRLTADS